MSEVGSIGRDLGRARRDIAVACRILAHAGLCEDILGHVSLRVGPDSLLVRCRGPHEAGLIATTEADVHLVGFDAKLVEDPAGESGYSPPKELPIHVRTMAARPDVEAVVHAHPPAVIAVDLAGLDLVPLVGAYNIPAAQMAADSIARYGRSVLIRRDDLADEMVAAMGERPACVLAGHGITTVGDRVAQAVARALALDSLARMTERVARCGGTPTAIPEADLAELPDLGGGFNEDLIWAHHQHRLVQAGLDLP